MTPICVALFAGHQVPTITQEISREVENNRNDWKIKADKILANFKGLTMVLSSGQWVIAE